VTLLDRLSSATIIVCTIIGVAVIIAAVTWIITATAEYARHYARRSIARREVRERHDARRRREDRRPHEAETTRRVRSLWGGHSDPQTAEINIDRTEWDGP
jgi:hypothetical protein